MEFFTEDGMDSCYSPFAVTSQYQACMLIRLLSGKWKVDIDIPRDISLENSVTRYEGEEKETFLTFVRGMLQWRPEDRKTAAELLKDPWLQIQ